MSIIESIICSTPVINIGFGEDGLENKRLSNIIHAPFIKEFEKSDFVEQCLNFDKFQEVFLTFLHIKNKIEREKISASLEISISDLTPFEFNQK